LLLDKFHECSESGVGRLREGRVFCFFLGAFVKMKGKCREVFPSLVRDIIISVNGTSQIHSFPMESEFIGQLL